MSMGMSFVALSDFPGVYGFLILSWSFWVSDFSGPLTSGLVFQVGFCGWVWR